MAAWERYWFEPVAAIRPYLLMRIVYAILALDLWTVTLPRGSRYGFGGFDVAHFAWLDALRPQPTPEIYVGLLLFIGMLALICALCDPGRWARALVALLHTYSWAMSLHDSFQHHYFLSLVLAAFVFLPRTRARDLVTAPGDSPPRVSAWAFALLGANVAIVYAFAGLSKLDVTWRSGEVLRMAPLSRLGSIQAFTESLGVPADVFWSANAVGVVALEWTIAVGYLVNVHRDGRRRWVSALAWLTFVLAVGFHTGAEVILALRIGWFTYYMIVIAGVFLLPGRVLHAVAGPALRAARWLQERIDAPSRRWSRRGLDVAAAVGGALAVAAVGLALDLPGAPVAGVAAALVVLGAALGPSAIGRPATPIALGIASALAAAALGTVVAASDARFEYYMSVGRQLDRFGQTGPAHDAYAHASLYGRASLEGLWSSGGSILRVRLRDGVATAVFTQTSPGARQLGFKPGDTSFVVRVNGQQFAGALTLRYDSGCYPEGRTVPNIGFMRRDGEGLVTHFFNFTLDAECRDVARYRISDTIWERIVGVR